MFEQLLTFIGYRQKPNKRHSEMSLAQISQHFRSARRASGAMKYRLEESVVSRVRWADPDRCGPTDGVGACRPWVEDGTRQLVDDLTTAALKPMHIAVREPA